MGPMLNRVEGLGLRVKGIGLCRGDVGVQRAK